MVGKILVAAPLWAVKNQIRLNVVMTHLGITKILKFCISKVLPPICPPYPFQMHFGALGRHRCAKTLRPYL